MIRDIVILAFVISMVLSFIVSAIAGRILVFAFAAFSYWIAFLVIALGVYVSTHFWPIGPKRAYCIAVPMAAALIVVLLFWVVGDFPKQFQWHEVSELVALLGPFFVANAGAYWLVVKNNS